MSTTADKPAVQRALSAHAAIGLLAGALLYLICLTGTVVVFYEEWQRAEQPNAPEMGEIAPAAVQAGIAEVLAREAAGPTTTHLYVHLPVPALPRTTITTDTQAFHLDARGRIVEPEENAWSEFLLALHYGFNIPGLAGFVLVGALGAMMLALIVSGVVAHPRIFRDAFRLRARDKSGLGLADWHNRLSVWTLPFAVAIALTGAMIGLGITNAYGLAAGFYKGDLDATYATIFGGEGEPDARKAPVADVASSLRWMAANHGDLELTYVILHDPMTAGQHVQIIGAHPRRLIYGETYRFDAQGGFHGTAGMADGALGQQMAASTYNLHFGNFGGLPVKIAYMLFGLALTVVSATGMYIWLGKRERRGLHAPLLRRLWSALVWGAPAALVASFVARLALGNDAPLVAIFWGGLALVLLAAGWRRAPARRQALAAG